MTPNLLIKYVPLRKFESILLHHAMKSFVFLFVFCVFLLYAVPFFFSNKPRLELATGTLFNVT